MTRWNVVLAGGVGSRFWPLSTPERPKQLLPLISSAPMLSDTLDRMSTLAPLERTLVLTNAGLKDAILHLQPGLPGENVIAEPRPAGTCAALAWAARVIEQRSGKDAVMICAHADWAIADVQGFRDTLSAAGELAERERALVTVGIVPSRPDPGFGYIQPGEPLSVSPSDRQSGPRSDGNRHGDDHAALHGASRVKRFVEKPDRARAAEMVEAGYLWNSGIFAWRAGDLLDEIRKHTPEVQHALDSAGNDLQKFFAETKSIAIDVGVLERSDRVLVIPGNFGWDDVGTWAALHRVRARDTDDNAVFGRAHALRATGNVVHAEHGIVVLYGVHDLVVVAQDGLVMVTSKESAADLKALLDSLPPDLRDT
jgi:mannose-1-phosphate guanylyltransferase